MVLKLFEPAMLGAHDVVGMLLVRALPVLRDKVRVRRRWQAAPRRQALLRRAHGVRSRRLPRLARRLARGPLAQVPSRRGPDPRPPRRPRRHPRRRRARPSRPQPPCHPLARRLARVESHARQPSPRQPRRDFAHQHQKLAWWACCGTIVRGEDPDGLGRAPGGTRSRRRRQTREPWGLVGARTTPCTISVFTVWWRGCLGVS